VTVCIAVRAGDNLVGFADRMLTSGDIQFEPAATNKLVAVTNSIVIMQAGDAAFNAEILRDVGKDVLDRIYKDPDNWWLVKDVVDVYVNYRNVAKRKRAEADLLSPLGLTFETWRDELHKFHEPEAEQLTRDLINYEIPHTAVIVTGVDPHGPHIYVVDDGRVSCNDGIGFAAIGIGARHAESQIMLNKHSWNSPLVDSALLGYIAKKRSEVAPGVGEGTDVFTIGPVVGSLVILPQELIAEYDKIYKALKEKKDEAREEARKQANEFVTEASRKAAEQAGSQQHPVEGDTAAENEPRRRTKRTEASTQG
jgi:hypothetical protein